MATQQLQKTEKNQMQSPYLSQVWTLRHQVSQPVSHRSLPALVQKMTPAQIPHPVMTHSPLQAKLPQPATEHLDPEYPSTTMKAY